MPELTRCRSPDAADECWHVYYGEVRVGAIARGPSFRGSTGTTFIAAMMAGSKLWYA
jgi:hypothetical protein